MASPQPQTRRQTSHATLTETQDANPQVIEAKLEDSTKGPVGIANFGTPVTFANFLVRE